MYYIYIYRQSGNLQDILQPFLVQSDESLPIIIQRNHLWRSLMRAMNSPTFSYYAVPLVQFSGEDAEDAGGPRREFFRYFLNFNIYIYQLIIIQLQLIIITRQTMQPI